MNHNLSDRLTRLVLDAQFVAFETLAKRPNLFRIVGRTHTETWHSMFLSWLLDPGGSHRLGPFALQRLLLATADEAVFAPAGKQFKVRKLAVFGNFEDARVLPNERDQKEKIVPATTSFSKSGRLDAFVEGITIEEKHMAGYGKAVMLIEQKVFAPADTGQCKRYLDWLRFEYPEPDVLRIPILLGPFDSSESPIDDEDWFILDYQKLHDDVLVPSLEHLNLDALARPLLEQYIDALRIPMNGTKLANSQEEKDLAHEIYKLHEATFKRLWQILAEDSDDPNLQALVKSEQEAGKKPITLEVTLEDGASELISANSGADLLRAVFAFLVKMDKMASIVPHATGKKRYLVNTEPKHITGNAYITSHEIDGGDGVTYYVELNASRQSASKYGQAVLRKAGFKVDVEDG